MTHSPVRPALRLLALLAVAAMFPAAAQDAPTTGFEDSDGARWTTHEEELAFLEAVDALSDRVEIDVIGFSLEGRPLQLVRIGHPAPHGLAAAQNMPVELHICTQHGNEPAGREACLIQLRNLALTDDPILVAQLSRQVTLFVPTANPDGREANSRTNANGTDLNRQHLEVDEPEVRALGRVIRDYKPVINMDHHEYGPSQPVVYDDDVLVLWPRNLNVHRPLRDDAFSFVVDHLMPCTEAAGYSADEYGLQSAGDVDLQQVAGDWDDGISRNAAGLRHSYGILVESAVSMNPQNPDEVADAVLTGDATGGAPATMRRRVESQVTVIDCALEWMRENGEAGHAITRDAMVAKRVEGEMRSAPTYFDGQDEDTTAIGGLTGANEPQSVQDPPFCGFKLQPDQVNGDVLTAFEVHDIAANEQPDGGLFVSMAQEAEPVIGLLLDERGERHLVAAEGLDDCSAFAATPARAGAAPAGRGGALGMTLIVLLLAWRVGLRTRAAPGLGLPSN